MAREYLSGAWGTAISTWPVSRNDHEHFAIDSLPRLGLGMEMRHNVARVDFRPHYSTVDNQAVQVSDYWRIEESH